MVQKRPPSYLWYGGSCSSKIVLTVSLISGPISDLYQLAVCVIWGMIEDRSPLIGSCRREFKRSEARGVFSLVPSNER